MNESLDLSIEPGADWHLTAQQRDRLTDLLDGYLSQLERGLPPPREDLIRANPDLAAPLGAYFQSLDELHDMAAGFQRPGQSPSGHSNASGDGGHAGHESTDSLAEGLPHQDEKRLGDFRLLREIGRGGMGVVYEAEQISLGRRVALKVLPFAAVLDSRQIARFKHEAQAAGQLNHPNIVSVFAVGVERGVHYYAMQYIDGQPLDRVIAEMQQRRGPESADRTKVYPPPTALAPTQRSLLTSRPANSSEYIRGVVGIGIDAARALHAAHENGIVHRDVKPSNLLLDGSGKIWVTDFGLARRATDATLTRTGDLVGTMRYMSPEQATGQMAQVDHRTDIYSLGATLYEMVTLEPAIAGQEGHALLREIERQDPRPPRQLQPKVPLDLQTVVMKGMAKRREDRYATANDFADDLQRVLDGKPIVARPPSLLDRAGRWGQRHREIVAAAAAVCLLAMLGFAGSTFLILREHKKTTHTLDVSEKNLQKAHKAVDELGQEVANRLAHVPGAAEIRNDVLRETLRYYRSFVEQDGNDPALQGELALQYRNIGKLSEEIGSINDAIEADREAIRIYKSLADANPANNDYPQDIAVSENNLGFALARVNKTAEARQAYEEAIRLQKGVLDKLENKEQCLTNLALARNNLGKLYAESGDVERATIQLDQAESTQRHLLDSAPDNPDRMSNLAATLINLASLYAGLQPQKAIVYYGKAAALQNKAVSLRHNDLIYQADLAVTYNNLGRAHSRQGDAAAAAESYARAVELENAVVLAAPAEKSYRRVLAVGYTNLGLEQARRGDAGTAEKSLRHAVELQEALVKQDPREADLKSSLGGMLNNLALFLAGIGRRDEATKLFEKAVDSQRQAISQAPDSTKYRGFLDKHYYNYARLLRETGRADEALKVALARRNLWANHPEELFSVAEELALAANEREVRDSPGASAEYGERAVETLKQAVAAGWKPKPETDWMKAFTAVKHRPDFLALTY